MYPVEVGDRPGRLAGVEKGALAARITMTFDPMTFDHRNLATALLRPVLEAGAVEMRHYRSGVTVEAKADNSPVTVADREAEAILIAGLVAMASRSHLTPETESYLARFPIKDRRDAGSSLKFCRLARGDADLYPRLGPTMEWDIAAGHAVLEAAGGGVADLDGRPLRYGKTAENYRSRHFVAWGRREVLQLASPTP